VRCPTLETNRQAEKPACLFDVVQMILFYGVVELMLTITGTAPTVTGTGAGKVYPLLVAVNV
jgi:hypothetical protein